MGAPLTLAAVHHRVPAPVTILLVLAGIALVMWTRMRGQPLQAKRLLVLPAVFVVLGVGDLTGQHAHYTAADIGFLVAGAAVAAVLGAARGATVELFSRDGELWQRYRPVTVALWLTLIAAKIILAVIARAAGAPGGAGSNGLLLALGISLLAETAVVGPRALATGVPFATQQDDRRSEQRDRRTPQNDRRTRQHARG
jgi:FtsH-binding integral membrane protein